MIHTDKEYNAILRRVDVLLENPDAIENTESEDYIELNILSDLVADYEEYLPGSQTRTNRDYQIKNG